jgi:hypothetical protein
VFFSNLWSEAWGRLNSISAARKGNTDMVMGNVAGTAAFITPSPVTEEWA